jgi:hypothetical protein
MTLNFASRVNPEMTSVTLVWYALFSRLSALEGKGCRLASLAVITYRDVGND